VIEAVGIIVPVHNEEERIAACLEALRAACASLPSGLPARVAVVLDTCSDRSGAIARSYRGDEDEVIEVSYRNVGRARHAGAECLLRQFNTIDRGKLWLATTDADSTVPSVWLQEQLALADAGVDGVAGTIRVEDWSPHSTAKAEAFEAFYASPDGSDDHEHVHGTNLAMRSDAYVAAGGFAHLESGEDHALWNALRHAGRSLVSTRRHPVITSSRRQGRAPHGFAGFLEAFSAPSK
jgi:glycosyltransferase involved in cell wall biosynthesis